jgi:signal transduction histidine kinase
LHRLVSNLISNAIKYTPRGGSVTATVRRDGREAEFSVQDTGVGIPPENIPHIFDRFYRVRNASTAAKQGLGLGLSFVAWIVNAHGGRIDVSSEPGKGARFTVRIPLAPGAEPPAVSAPAIHSQPA